MIDGVTLKLSTGPGLRLRALQLLGGQVWGYNPVCDDRSDFTQSRPL